MAFEYIIEVCSEQGDSTTKKGAILESFAGLFMKSQGYGTTTTIRLTGIEVDLLCDDKQTGEQIMVECKAYRSTISAEVITKLFGTTAMKGYSSGWLISTHTLGKDAKGLTDEWSEQPAELRRKLRVFTPDTLVPRLVAAGVIVDPSSLLLDSNLRRSNEAYLLLSGRGQFWALPILDEETGVAAYVAIFEAGNGTQVKSSNLLAWLLQTDTTLSNLSPSGIGAPTPSGRLKEELDNIVGVPMADHWADYRPARPTDYVGRETIQDDIFSFLDQIASGTTSTRLLALKAPSGWGKSSSVLKIAAKARSKRFRSKFFVHAVDSRGATTDRFPELAFVSALKAAMDDNFIPKSEIRIGSASSLFSSEQIQNISKHLTDSGRVLCIFFDQFEELLYKEELSSVFDQMRFICNAVEEAQANICIGFSWKTDGTITTDHGAYHLWHSLADRRYEVNLPPFDDREVSIAIGKFGKELGEPVNIQLRRLLEDHCQGYPWLLKKLCVNILHSVRGGSLQSDLVARSLNIGSLFQKDLEQLTPSELSCLRHIGRESPAEFFTIVDTYGDHVVNSLMNKRLIIRSGVRLSLYWDIFREFVLTDRVPNIPVTYLPQANFARYIDALDYIQGKPSVSYVDLAEAMNLNHSSADNLVRDLANIGHVDARRSEGILKPIFDNREHAFEIAHGFWRSHDLIGRIEAQFGDSPFSLDEFVEIFRHAYLRKSYADQTLVGYARRALGWLASTRLIENFVADFWTLDTASKSRADGFANSHGGFRKRKTFLGEAPPEAVMNAVEALADGPVTRATLERLVSRNAVSAALGLELVYLGADRVFLTPPNEAANPLTTVVASAQNQWTIILAQNILTTDPATRGEQIGAAIAKEIDAEWAQGSLTRYGSGLKRWASWLQQHQDRENLVDQSSPQ